MARTRLLPRVIADVASEILNLLQPAIPIEADFLLSLIFRLLVSGSCFDRVGFLDACELRLEEPWFERRVKALQAKSKIC